MIDTDPATIDVWRASLLLSHAELAGLSRCLDGDERRRAARFHFERDRRRFLAARGQLRHLLASYLDTDPERLEFGYGAQGKPYLAGYPEVQFNLSHAADTLVVAVARGRRLGIDVEQTIPEGVMNEVRERVSSTPEWALLETLDRSARETWFSRLWTRKEAYIKADGRGMSLDLKLIDVLSVGNRVQLWEESPPVWRSSPQWTVHDLDPGAGLAGALVAEGSGWRTAHFDWPSGGR
jgi:4'-phosphopantetheinyl transferase